jgi:hypothetical protein
MDRIAIGQGLFYVATGVWPLVDIHSFEKVTGPKRDDWLVKTVGVLVTVIGGVLLAAGARGRTTPETAWLGAGSALGLAAIDVVYTSKGVIAPIYLADAAVEVGLAAGWAAAARGARDRAPGEARPHVARAA